jgi:drug/metabolite transporter (DMT)-like permease
MTASPPSASVELPPQRRGAHWALPALIAGVFAIGFSPIFVRLSDIGPVATAVDRLGLPLPFFWAYLLARPERDWTRPRPAALIALAGAFFAGDLAFWHWALKFTPVADATLLANVSPVLVVALAWVLFNERVGRTFIIGATIAVVGMVVLVARNLDLSSAAVRGDGLALIASLFYAAYLLTVAHIRKYVSTLALMTIGSTVGTILLIPVALIMDHTLFPTTLHGWLAVGGLALIGQAIGQLLLMFAFAHVSSGLGAIMLLMQPVFAAGAAWIILGEAITPLQALGGAMILGGLAIARRDELASKTS